MDTIDRLIEHRRISPEAVQAFQIQAGRGAWEYPTPAGGRRAKRYDWLSGPKYWWVNHLAADWLYHAPDCPAAVQASGGVLWLATGEADVWALRSAGIRHAASTGYGEGHVPAHLPDLLRALGVVLVYIAPDLDEAGKRWAWKVYQALQGSGIELQCLRLPEELGQGGDLGALWKRHTGPVPFEHRLLSLPRYRPEPPKPPAPATVNTPDHAFGAAADDVAPEYRAIVAAALGVIGYKSDGFSENVSCPFPEHHNNGDAHPSAALHRTKGLYCRTAGRWYRWTDVAAALGLPEYRDWLRQQRRPPAAVKGDPAHLSNQARAELRKRGAESAARLLDCLYLAGWEPGREFTAKEALKAVQSLGVPMSRRTVYRALGFCATIFRAGNAGKKNRGEKRGTKYPTTAAAAAASEKRGRGRPARRYLLPGPAEVEQALGVRGPGVCPEPAVLASVGAYRVAVYAGLIAEQPGAYTRRELGKRVGVSGRTTRNYDKRAGVVVVERLGSGPVLDSGQVARLPEERKEVPGLLWLEDEDGQRVPPVRGAAWRMLARGKVLRWRWRGANWYDVAKPRRVPEPKMPRWLADWLRETAVATTDTAGVDYAPAPPPASEDVAALPGGGEAEPVPDMVAAAVALGGQVTWEGPEPEPVARRERDNGKGRGARCGDGGRAPGAGAGGRGGAAGI